MVAPSNHKKASSPHPWHTGTPPTSTRLKQANSRAQQAITARRSTNKGGVNYSTPMKSPGRARDSPQITTPQRSSSNRPHKPAFNNYATSHGLHYNQPPPPPGPPPESSRLIPPAPPSSSNQGGPSPLLFPYQGDWDLIQGQLPDVTTSLDILGTTTSTRMINNMEDSPLDALLPPRRTASTRDGGEEQGMLSSSSGSRRPGTSSSGGVRQQALAEVERWRRLAEENEKEAMKLKKMLMEERKIWQEKNAEWKQEKDKAMLQTTANIMTKAREVIDKIQAEMRVAVSDAREREEKALEEAKKAKFEAQAYIRRMEEELLTKNEAEIERYKTTAEEAKQAADAEREASQLQAVESRRELQRCRQVWEEEMAREVDKARAEGQAQMMEKLQAERKRFAALEGEVRKQFDLHCQAFEKQMRDKATSIFSAMKAELLQQKTAALAASHHLPSSAHSHPRYPTAPPPACPPPPTTSRTSTIKATEAALVNTVVSDLRTYMNQLRQQQQPPPPMASPLVPPPDRSGGNQTLFNLLASSAATATSTTNNPPPLPLGP